MNKIMEATPISKESFSRGRQHRQPYASIEVITVKKENSNPSQDLGFNFVSYTAKGRLSVSQGIMFSKEA